MYSFSLPSFSLLFIIFLFIILLYLPLSVPLFHFLCSFRYYCPTPTLCLSADAAIPPHLEVALGPASPPSWLLRFKNKFKPYTEPLLHHFTAAQASLSACPSCSCCSAFSTCPQPATRGEKRVGEVAVVVATTYPSLSPLHTTWPYPTFYEASALLLSWWATPAR